ncbi:MAG: ABC transporter permease [Defluviitaleaceae bacterium]|nr:ABC transporter permease [Defluviitaleaceae bacterium]
MKRSGMLSLLSSILVIIAGLLIGLIILLISNAEQALPAFTTLLTFGASSMRNIGDVLLFATPIMLTGLSVTFAFKTGLFNIGASGQFAFGGLVAIFIGVEFTFLPPPIRIVLCILAAAAAGALWGAIPGILKALCNVHEVISSIMTNYIGMFFVSFMITSFIFDQGRGTSTRLPSDSSLPTFGLENIFRDGARTSNINIGIIIAILIVILIYIILEKTSFGYELKACGFNKDAAKYAGINENKNIVLSMMISGALAGVGGALNYLNDTGLSMSATDSMAMEGFTGISVAFLGLNHPIGIIFSSALISYLFLGGTRMQLFGFSIEIVEIVISIIIYFCAFVFLVKSFFGETIVKFGKKNTKDAIEADSETGGETV